MVQDLGCDKVKIKSSHTSYKISLPLPHVTQGLGCVTGVGSETCSSKSTITGQLSAVLLCKRPSSKKLILGHITLPSKLNWSSFLAGRSLKPLVLWLKVLHWLWGTWQFIFTIECLIRPSSENKTNVKNNKLNTLVKVNTKLILVYNSSLQGANHVLSNTDDDHDASSSKKYEKGTRTTERVEWQFDKTNSVILKILKTIGIFFLLNKVLRPFGASPPACLYIVRCLYAYK